jgi:hypothetical protein
MIPLAKQVTITQHQGLAELATLAKEEIAITAAQYSLIVVLIPSIPSNSLTISSKCSATEEEIATTTTFYSGYLSLLLF